MTEQRADFETIKLHPDFFKEFTPQDWWNLYLTTISIMKESYIMLLKNDFIFWRDETQELKESIQKWIDNPELSVNDMIYIQLRFLENAVYAWLVEWIDLYKEVEWIESSSTLLTWKTLDKFYQFKNYPSFPKDIQNHELLHSLLRWSLNFLFKIFKEDCPQEDKTKITDLFWDTVVAYAFDELNRFQWYDEEFMKKLNKEAEEVLKKRQQQEELQKEESKIFDDKENK